MGHEYGQGDGSEDREGEGEGEGEGEKKRQMEREKGLLFELFFPIETVGYHINYLSVPFVSIFLSLHKLQINDIPILNFIIIFFLIFTFISEGGS